MTDDQQPAPGAAERRRSTARSAAAKRVRGDFVAQIPKRFSEGFTERIDLIIRIVFMVVVAVGCYLVLEPFLTAILIAAVLAVVTWPVFNKLRSGMRQSSTAAASVMVLSIVVLVLIPLSFLLVALAQQVPRGVQAAAAWLKDPLPILQAVQSIPYAGDWLYGELVSAIDPQTFAHTMQRILEPLSTWVLNAAVNVGSGVMQLAFVTFIVFFFYRDGSWFADRISAVVERVSGGIAEEITKILVNTTRSVVFGIVGTAIGQGLVAGIGFWIAGVPGVLILSFAVCDSNRPSAHLAAGSRLALEQRGTWHGGVSRSLGNTCRLKRRQFHQAALDCPRHFNADRAHLSRRIRRRARLRLPRPHPWAASACRRHCALLGLA